MTTACIEEQRRLAFEEQFPNGFGYTFCDGFYHMPERTTYKKSELMQHRMYLHAWRWWNKALDSVVIDLSKHHGGQAIPGSERMFLSDARAAIEAAGLKVKP